ncbi:MAG: extracellular solute-binding protein [Pseudomonadota bacterium]
MTRTIRTPIIGAALALGLTIVGFGASGQPKHGIAMYGEPQLGADFQSLPYANANAPKGGRIVSGETGSFDSLNPHIRKGRVPWQLRFLAYESLLGRSYDEPFSLYGLLAETVETNEERSFVEFTLRAEARFSDGSPVTVEDVLWSYETLGTQGHPRYASAWAKIATAEQTGPRSLRFTFNQADRELPLILGLRPILKKAQWEGVDFAESGLETIPIATAPYVIDDFEAGRFVSLKRNPDYWGADVPFRRGTMNLDEIRMEFFGDATAMFEAFKAGELNTMRETNVAKWDAQYDFPRVQSGEVVKSIIEHQRPTGITGFVMNTRRAPFDDWRVREALITAFNFEFINETVNGTPQPRIASYFHNSELAMQAGPAQGKVLALLEPFADDLEPGAIEGYALPQSDGTERNRANLARALDLLADAGWDVVDGTLMKDGTPFSFELLLQAGSAENSQIADLYASALERLGIDVTIEQIDGAAYKERTQTFDFDMTRYRRGLSLSPGNEQSLYWGSDAATTDGSRNWMGVQSPAIDSLVNELVTATSRDDFLAATRALDRTLVSGRYVIPFWYSNISRLAHDKNLTYQEPVMAYGDWIGFLPDVWWHTGEDQ